MRYSIIQVSSYVFRSDLGSTPTTIASVSATSNADWVAAFTNLYIVDGVGALIQYTGSSSSTVSGAPYCKLIEFASERIWCANQPTVSGSIVSVSSFGGASFWTIPSVMTADSPTSFTFQKDDGDQILCVKNTPWGMVFGKRRSLHIIKGFDNDTFRKVTISPDIGCSDDRSMQMKDGVLEWLAENGVYTWPGAGKPLIASEEITDIIKTLRQNSSNSNSWVTSSQSDFESGSLNGAGPGAPVSATYMPGSITTSSATFVDNVYSSGSISLVQGSTTVYVVNTVGVFSGYQSGVAAAGAVANSGFESASMSNWSNSGAFAAAAGSALTAASGVLDCAAAVGWGGSYLGTACANMPGSGSTRTSKAEVIRDSDSAVLYARTHSTTAGAVNNCAESTFDISTQTVPMRIRFSDVDLGATIVSASFSSGAVAGQKIVYGAGSMPGGCFTFGFASTVFFDLPEPMAVPVSTYTSTCFDTAFSTPIWGSFDATLVRNGAGRSADMTVQVATSCSGAYGSPIAVSTSVAMPATTARQFLKYNIRYSNDVTTATAIVSTITLVAATTGTFRSAVLYAGENMSTWGVFNAQDSASSGGGVLYYMRSSPTTFDKDAALPSWSLQSNNATIGISTGKYIQWGSSFTLSLATGVVQVDRVAVNWTDGTAVAPVASAVLDRRYFLCAAFSTSSVVNSSCLVHQKNGRWATLDGPKYGALGRFGAQLLAGGADEGQVWKIMQDDVYNDAGAPIASEWISKDFMFAPNGRDWPTGEKSLTEIWLESNLSTGTLLSVGYAANKSTSYTSKILDLGAYGNAVNRMTPLDAGYALGKYFRFRFYLSQADHAMRVNAYSIYGEPKPKTED